MNRDPSKQLRDPPLGHDPTVEKPCFKRLLVLSIWPDWFRCSSLCWQECGWTLAQDVFAVDFFVRLKPLPLQSVHSSVAFSAVSSVTPVTLSWDFGDFSARVNATGSDVTHAASHKYGLPGRYTVGLMAWVGNSKVRWKCFFFYCIFYYLTFMFCVNLMSGFSMEINIENDQLFSA